jgi:hypothetical protein
MNRMPAAADRPGYWMKPLEASWLGSPGRLDAQQRVGFATNLGEIRPINQKLRVCRSGRDGAAPIVALPTDRSSHAAAAVAARVKPR